jgi:anti-sigma regulatory factor (Ser/Thr protein kinase)
LAEESPFETIRLELPASNRRLNLVGACITALLEREEGLVDRARISQQVELAVHETCINIVEHAYIEAPGRIVVVLAVHETPRKLVVDLYDTGIAFDMGQANQVGSDEIPERGFGLFLIYQLMDRVTYTQESGANHWRLEKNL